MKESYYKESYNSPLVNVISIESGETFLDGSFTETDPVIDEAM